MKLLLKAASAALCIASVSMLFAPSATADSWNKKTVVTLSGPVEIPGVHLAGWAVLPAGTYVFKLVNSTVNRHIVQISNQDESVVYATILAIPNTRLTPSDDTVITFRERPAGQPPALRAWFYPGDTWGDEFVYPKARAMQLAESNNTPVLYSALDTPTEVTEPILPPAPPAVSQMNEAPVMAYSGDGKEVELSQAVTAPPSNTQMAAAEAPSAPAPSPFPASTATELPRTASPLASLMLGGAFALGSALGIQLFKRHYL
jgi:hypothetical protein